jgi:hypothetical protein
MVNPYAGEVAVTVNGCALVAKLTLGALAEMEETLQSSSLIELVERFEARKFTTRDVLVLLLAGLRGGGWAGSADDLARADIGGGPIEAARTAALLLTRAFSSPGET